MTRVSKSFLLLLTALWLPMQMLTALVMPLSLLATPASAQEMHPAHEQAEGMACHEHADKQAGADSTLADAGDDPAPCQHCSICQMACTGVLPASSLTPRLGAPERRVPAPALSELASHISEPLDHPPRPAH